ncbi:MAG: MBL fold metallo-hydrolase [Prolixibacteraceae bacterium]|nr:MBL fold metallo-hydrolase [Prolixibacteraceae bacterium]
MNDNNEHARNQTPPLGGEGGGIKVFTFNPIQENSFVIWDKTGECAIIDAGCYKSYEFEKLDSFIKSNNLKPVKLINTHCHFDHIMGVEQCREAYKLKWEAHSGDAFWVENAQKQGAMFGIPMQPVSKPDTDLKDGDKVSFGNTLLEVIHVPGHSPGSICFYNEASKILIAGDVLFRGSIGRTDLPGGNYKTLITGIKSKLLVLPGEVKVYPGHGPATTIVEERNDNPFLI